jgi:outer membrane lipoprotein SlyB
VFPSSAATIVAAGTGNASPFHMRFVRSCVAALVATTLAAGCATTATYTTDPYTDEYRPRTGIVEHVRQVVREVRGNPAGGAAAGALIGAVLFGGHGPRTLFGAAAGAATGAALSQGRYETRAYEVVVRFDNGTRGVFTFRDYSPFAPGDRIALGPDGPRRIVY